MPHTATLLAAGPLAACGRGDSDWLHPFSVACCRRPLEARLSSFHSSMLQIEVTWCALPNLGFIETLEVW